MSQMIHIPDDIYAKLAEYAAEKGEAIDTVAATVLAHGIVATDAAEKSATTTNGLDWQTASAEAIIEDIFARRVERERDIQL